MPEELSQLMDHMRWADSVVWKAVLATSGAAEDERIRQLLHHVHSVQWAYLQLFRDEPVELPEPAEFPRLHALRRWGEEGHAELDRFASEVGPDELGREIEFPWAERLVEDLGSVHPVDVGQALLQVTSHSTAPRGQITARIRELGGEPP